MILTGAVILASLAGWTAHAMFSTSPAPDVIRLTIPVLEGITAAENDKPTVAISRDGRTVAYVADDVLRIRRVGRVARDDIH